MSLFEKKPEIPKKQFKEFLKKTDIKIGQGRQLSNREKENMATKYFPRKYDSSISGKEFDRSLQGLKKEKVQEKDFVKKTKMGREIKLLEEIKKRDFPSKI